MQTYAKSTSLGLGLLGPTWTDIFLGPPLVKTRRLRASGAMWGQGSLRGCILQESCPMSTQNMGLEMFTLW